MSEQKSVPVEQMDALDREMLRLGVAYLRRKHWVEQEQKRRAEAVKMLRPGGKRPVYDPRNAERKLWHGTASETSYKAEIVDHRQLEEWVRENYPAKLRSKTKLKEGFTEADVLQIAQTYASYMFETVPVVEDWVKHELVLKSQLAQQPMGWGGEVGESAPPGIEVSKAASAVVLTITKHAAEAIDELILAGVIDEDGNIIASSLGGE